MKVRFFGTPCRCNAIVENGVEKNYGKVMKLNGLVYFAIGNQNQGGRSCTGARVAPAEKFGLGRKF